MEMIEATIRVYGLVQGVGFRYFVFRNAEILGVNGYTKNNLDSSVVSILEGEATKVNQLLKLIKQGPSRGRVDHFDVAFSEFNNKFKRFDIL